MEKEINIEFILRYLDGNAHPDEEKILRHWLETNNSNRKYFNNIKNIWDTPDNPLPDPNLEQAWLIIQQKAGIKDQGIENIRRFELKADRVSIISNILRSRVFQLAAIFLFVILIPYFIWSLIEPAKLNELIVGNARQESIQLSDGTQITLDAASTFRYPKELNKNNREVYLNGEGYFRVAPDPNKPFIVNANYTIITVLGTEFNIRAWKRSKRVTVAVVEGRVAFRAANKSGPDAEVVIHQNQVSKINKNEFPSLPKNSDVKPHLSWRQREIYFQSTPLLEVLDQLERWYDIEILLPDAQSAQNLVTIFIENKPIEHIVEVIALMNDFQYHREDSKIIFSEKK